MVQRIRSILLPFAAILLAGCQQAAMPFECDDAIGCVTVAPGEPVQIGLLQVQSGDQEVFGLTNLRSIELALDEWGHELLSHPIETRSEDSMCSKEGGATAASKIVADPQILGIIGPTCSGAAAGAMKVVAEAGLVMVSGSSTAPSLTSAGGGTGFGMAARLPPHRTKRRCIGPGGRCLRLPAARRDQGGDHRRW